MNTDQLKNCYILYIKTGYNIAQDHDQFKDLPCNKLKVLGNGGVDNNSIFTFSMSQEL